MTPVDGSLIKEPIMTTTSNQLAKEIREAMTQERNKCVDINQFIFENELLRKNLIYIMEGHASSRPFQNAMRMQ